MRKLLVYRAQKSCLVKKKINKKLNISDRGK